jgi:hypothetical protein
MRLPARRPPVSTARPIWYGISNFRTRSRYYKYRAPSDRDCRFDLFNIPCRICRRSTIHRTRTRHPERKSKSEGHCGSYRAGRERRNSQIPTSTQELLPTSTHSNGFCIIRVCISSSSSSTSSSSSSDPRPVYSTKAYAHYKQGESVVVCGKGARAVLRVRRTTPVRYRVRYQLLPGSYRPRRLTAISPTIMM